MKKYNAKLVGLSKTMEEEVTVNISGITIVGFSTVCPYKISVGNTYPVELGLVFLDDVKINKISEDQYGLERIDNSYKYLLYGKVIKGCIDLGHNILISDDYFDEYSYLEGSFVKIIADRISVDFLTED